MLLRGPPHLPAQTRNGTALRHAFHASTHALSRRQPSGARPASRAFILADRGAQLLAGSRLRAASLNAPSRSSSVKSPAPGCSAHSSELVVVLSRLSQLQIHRNMIEPLSFPSDRPAGNHSRL